MVDVAGCKAVMRKAHQMLDIATAGYNDLAGAEPARRISGLYNLAVFGRTVTFTIQNIRTYARPEFNAWYELHQTAMDGVPLLDFWKALRNEILKDSGPRVGSSMYVEHLGGSDFSRLMQNPPPGAKSFFMGDQLGGSGWTVVTPDGETVKYYIQLPPDIASRVRFQLTLPNVPGADRGATLVSAGAAYCVFLRSIVREADIFVQSLNTA